MITNKKVPLAEVRLPLKQNTTSQTNEWWNNKEFVAELDTRYDAMESGEDQGVSWEEVKNSIERLRVERYGQ